MTSWKTYRAEDYCLTVTDGTHDSPKPQVEGRYLITSKHLKPSGIDFSSANKICEYDYQKIIQRSKVEQYDILFSMIGTIGNIHRVTMPTIDFAVKNMGIFKMGGDADKSLWMYYWLQSPIAKEYIQSRITGSTQGYLTLGNLRDFPVCVPPLKEQRRIAGILGAIDDKIENNRRINTNLELQAQALYKQWFVDNRNEDWETKKLENIIDIGSGKGLPRIDFAEGGLYPILGANGQIGRTNKFLIDKKDNILFTGRVGTLGNVFRLQQKRAWLSDNTLIITPKKEYYNYVYFFLKNSNLKEFNVGSTQPLVRQSDIKEMDIFIPDLLTLEAFEGKCIAMFNKINQVNAEIDILATLRDTLLPKLMNGEIKL